LKKWETRQQDEYGGELEGPHGFLLIALWPDGLMTRRL
jgi:hypothetical protein